MEAGEDKHLRIALTKIEAAPEAAVARTAQIEAAPSEPPQPTTKTEIPPEKEFTNSLGMKFVLIPAGIFQMGSSVDEEDRYDNEQRHQVTIGRPFFLQTTPVTQGQWQSVMGENPSFLKIEKPSFFKKWLGGVNEDNPYEDHPVEGVSWYGAQEFLARLNRMEKTDKYRLPSEGEWEYACRAGSTTKYSFGDDEAMLQDYAWYAKNSKQETHPVGQKKPNACGLYDMHGNVWEWCLD